MASGEREALLGLQRALTEEQFQAFKYLLEERLPLSQLRPATRPDLCSLLLQHFPGRALHVAAAVLRQLPRPDLLQRYQLPGEDEALGVPDEAGGARGAGGDARGAGGDSRAGQPRLLTERDLMQVARRLGREWQEVGIECLGLERSRLDQIREDNPHSAVLQIFEMLREWRKRQGGAATAPRLRECLRGARVDPEVLALLQGW
ncbi:CRADD protein, partial [Chauna torquata]|nr:CRADD protein [Chauna torquata]